MNVPVALANNISIILAVATVLVFAIPIVRNPFRGAGRLFSPTSMSCLMLMAIFGIRPIAIHFWGGPLLYGIDPSSGFRFAQRVGMLSAIGFAAGTAVAGTKPNFAASNSAPRRITRSGNRQEIDFSRLTARAVLRVSIVGLCLGILLVVAKGGVAGARAIVGGRSEAASAVIEGLPVFVLVLPLLGSVAAAIYILCVAGNRKLAAGEALTIAAAVMVSAISNITLGNRRFIIPSLLVPLAAIIFARRGKLPRLAVPALPVTLGIFLVLPFVRSAGARTPGQSLTSAIVDRLVSGGVVGSLRNFFTSYDTEMFDYIALIGPRLGSSVPYGAGRGTFLEFVQYPLPGSLAGPMYSDSLLQAFYGAQKVRPVESSPGTLVFDFGLIGMMIGMFAMGWFLRRIERAVSGGGKSNAYMACFAVLAGYAPVIARTDSTQAVWWTLYTMSLVFLVRAFYGVKRPVEPAICAVPGTMRSSIGRLA